MSANTTDKRTERVFVQERFYERCKVQTLFDQLTDSDADSAPHSDPLSAPHSDTDSGRYKIR